MEEMLNMETNDFLNSLLRIEDNNIVIITTLYTVVNLLKNNCNQKFYVLNISDNTMGLNEDNKEKNFWRIHLVELLTEQDYYLEIQKAQDKKYSVRCYSIDNSDHKKNLVSFELPCSL